MSTLKYTPVDEIEEVQKDLRQHFESGALKNIAYRKNQLLSLAYLIYDNASRFEEALAADLHRPGLESQFLEIGATIGEIKTAYKNVESWAKPERPPFHPRYMLMRPLIRKEAKGVVLIISPFNYPLWLSFGPVAGAIAAGNCVLLKPSEQCTATSALVAELVPKYMDPGVLRIVNGDASQATKLLELRWDHILYTGSERVGRIVALAGAKQLTPVTLELGGKCPVFIDPNCDLETAARRLLWGKIANAGQTCVAPDYVLVPKECQHRLVEAFKTQYQRFYPDSNPPSADGAFAHLISPAAFSRVEDLVKKSKGTIVAGGATNGSENYIAPTIVKDVKGDDALMSQEIFGPVLPIVPVENLDEAIAFVNARDHPLAVYMFSQDAAFKKKVTENTTSGAAIANETIIHPGVYGLPFGGIGPSGNGYTTGKYSFDTFTQLRGTIDVPSWFDRILAFRFPPYTPKKRDVLMKKFYPTLPPRPSLGGTSTSRRWIKRFLLGLALAVVGLLVRNPGRA